MAIAATTLEAPTASPVPAAVRPADAPKAEEELSFWDVLDVINPLQHLPIVGNIYRAVTGDELKEGPRVVGGILFGGVLGGVAAVANVIIEEKTGRDIGGNMIATVFGDDAYPAKDGATAIAEAPGGASGKPLRIVPDQMLAGIPANDVARNDRIVTAELDKPAAKPRRPAARAVNPAPAAPLKIADTGKPADTGSLFKAENTAATSLDGQVLPPKPRLLSAGEVPAPSKMPQRDTIPANTSQARQAALEISQRRMAGLASNPPVARKPDAAPASAPASPAPSATPASPAKATASTAATAQQTALPTVNPGFSGAIDPSVLPEIMMRNLAKYEQTKRTTVPRSDSVNVSG
jgi:hypothetical protein